MSDITWVILLVSEVVGVAGWYTLWALHSAWFDTRGVFMGIAPSGELSLWAGMLYFLLPYAVAGTGWLEVYRFPLHWHYLIHAAAIALAAITFVLRDFAAGTTPRRF